MINHLSLDVKVNLDMEEVVENLSSSNINYLVDFLEENGYIEEQYKSPSISIVEEKFNKSVDLLKKSYYLLGNDDINNIIDLAKRL